MEIRGQRSNVSTLAISILALQFSAFATLSARTSRPWAANGTLSSALARLRFSISMFQTFSFSTWRPSRS